MDRGPGKDSSMHKNTPSRRGKQATVPPPWTATTAWHRCPLCGGTRRLASSVTDPAAVICTRVASDVQVRTVGFLHELRQSAAWAPWRTSLARLTRIEPQQSK